MLFPARELPVAGRPLANLSFALNNAAGGADLAGYHLVNLSLHIGCALLMFGLVRRTLALPSLSPFSRAGATVTAFAASLLWAVHPLNSEVVNYLTQRTESMMALCLLAMLYAGRRAWDGRTRAWQTTSVAACAAGMACKESMAVAPVLLILYDAVYLFGGIRPAIRQRWRYYLASASTWILLALLVGSGPRSLSAGFSTGITPSTYLLNQSRMVARYLRLAFWPDTFVLNYGGPIELSLASVLPYVITMGVMLVAAAVLLAMRPRIGFLAVWVFVTLAPTSSLVPIATEVGAERRMYLPLMAIAVALVLLLRRSAWWAVPKAARESGGHEHAQQVATAIVLILAAALSVRTIRRNRDYESGLRLAQTSADGWPTPVTALMLGTELAAAGQHGAALPHLRAAAEALPRARYNLGVELFNQGDLDGALDQLQRFVEAEPGLLEVVPARSLIGRVHAAQGRWDAAVREFERTLQMAPRSNTARELLVSSLQNLGASQAESGDVTRAVETFRRAVDLDPTNAVARQNLATALEDQRAQGR